MNKKIQVSIMSIFIAAALIGSAVTLGDNASFATKKSSNDAEQAILQGQASEQNAQCVSGDVTFLSCNNVGFQFQNNEGNLALGQQ
ncbi:hypothetical protein BH23THE1_BH23THE1_17540 [soil metagenome]